MSYYDQRGQQVDQQFNMVFPSAGSVPHHPDALLATLSDADHEALRTAIHHAGADLRTYPNTIVGVHFARPEVARIVDWVLHAAPTERLGMVLDQPGMGKTVLMRMVLECLEAAHLSVLAIKADTLSGITTYDDLLMRLRVPLPLEACACCLTTDGPFVILLDQLDALSLTLTRERTTLDILLSTLARLRGLNGVRIIASCRVFDKKNDPRLSTITVDREFPLAPLSEEQVNNVLRTIRIDPASLLPAHRALLTIPLHLDIYARIVADHTPMSRPERFQTLQDLYDALWRKQIETVPPEVPSPTARIAAIYRLVDAMQQQRQVTVPLAVLDEHTEAATYLERVGWIRRTGNTWLFLHQTLFDYCYARRFVAQGRSLYEVLLAGPQGLFERPQMVQVLAYLRGADRRTYRQELTALLWAPALRVHLRLLLIGWFGSLPDPTTDEISITRRLLHDAEDWQRFLRAARGNVHWFSVLSADVLPTLLHTDDTQRITTITAYLSTLLQHCPQPVLALLRPHLGQSAHWDDAIIYCLSQLKDWHYDEALAMVCEVMRRGHATTWERLCLYNLAQSHPSAGCIALRVYLDRALEHWLAQEQTDYQPEEMGADSGSWAALRLVRAWGQQWLGEYGVHEVMERAVHVCPESILAHIVPWLVRAAVALTRQRSEEEYAVDPVFADGWYEKHKREGAVFAQQVAQALHAVAQTHPSTFRPLATRLASVDALAVQRVLAQGFLGDPETYAEDIVAYLTADTRRLSLGEPRESPRYDSCQLYSAAFQHVDAGRRALLEQMILSLRPVWEQQALRYRGLTQLHFLKSAPLALLSETARRTRQELERKFPNFTPHSPHGIVSDWVGAPISQEAQAHMSDEAWLGAMRTYDDATQWGVSGRFPLQGGIQELAFALTAQVKNAPERFYQLSQRFDDTIALAYIAATIIGLAESHASAQWVFEVVRRFAARLQGESRLEVCRALESRATDGVPDDLLAMMGEWALHDPDPTAERGERPAQDGERYDGGDPHSHGINTNRGRALQAVCTCALRRQPPQAERAFQLLEHAASDPSTAVRACVIESLGALLQDDPMRTLALFEHALRGHPQLLRSSLVHRVLSWTYYHHFSRLRPVIEALMSDSDAETRQAGARVACLAAFRYSEAHVLATQALQGDPALRYGAAQVYARNLAEQDVAAICQARLLPLMHDPDEQVRAGVGRCFKHLRPEHLDGLRSFIEAFIHSPALRAGATPLIHYFKQVALDEHALTLRAVACLLDIAGEDIVDIRTSTSILESDMVHLPLTVYLYTTDATTQSQAIDLFERLLLLGSRSAHQVLVDWDRQ
jgi:hypothetical protein